MSHDISSYALVSERYVSPAAEQKEEGETEKLRRGGSGNMVMRVGGGGA